MKIAFLTSIYPAHAEKIYRENPSLKNKSSAEQGDFIRWHALSSYIRWNELLEERGREFFFEGKRRTDMIRFGEFTREWEFKDPTSVDDTTKNLFPVPSSALLSNPNLTQNPGY